MRNLIVNIYILGLPVDWINWLLSRPTPEDVPPPPSKEREGDESTEEAAQKVFHRESQEPDTKKGRRTYAKTDALSEKPAHVSNVSTKVLGKRKRAETDEIAPPQKKVRPDIQASITSIRERLHSSDAAGLVQCLAEVQKNKLYNYEPGLLHEIFESLEKSDVSTRTDEQSKNLHQLLIQIFKGWQEPQQPEELLRWILQTCDDETLFEDITFFTAKCPDALPEIFNKFKERYDIHIVEIGDDLRIDIPERGTADFQETKSILEKLDQAFGGRCIEVQCSWDNACRGTFPLQTFCSKLTKLHILEGSLDARIQQITKAVTDVEFEGGKSRLSPQQIRDLAYFIESKIVPTNKVAQQYFFSSETTLARDIHYDKKSREICIIAHPTHSDLRAGGLHKQALSAAAIPFSVTQDVLQVAQLSHVIHQDSALEGHVETVGELPFYERLRDVPGIAHLRSFIDLTETCKFGTAPPMSISLIFDRAHKGNLGQVLKRETLSRERQVNIGQQIIHTRAEMEKRGVYHGDLKTPNILLDSSDRIFITDFGKAFFVDVHTQRGELEGNAYSAYWYTPPELLFREETLPKFGLDPSKSAQDCMKIESWVTGMILLEIVLGRPSWATMLMNKGYPPELTPREKELMEQEYEAIIINSANALSQIPESERSESERLVWAICNLLHFDPSKRWSCQEADTYMRRGA